MTRTKRHTNMTWGDVVDSKWVETTSAMASGPDVVRAAQVTVADYVLEQPSSGDEREDAAAQQWLLCWLCEVIGAPVRKSMIPAQSEANR